LPNFAGISPEFAQLSVALHFPTPGTGAEDRLERALAAARAAALP